MSSQDFLDLKRRNLVTPGLDDIHAVAAQDAVRTILAHGHITRSKPAVPEGIAGRVRSIPVLMEHGVATNLNFSGHRIVGDNLA